MPTKSHKSYTQFIQLHEKEIMDKELGLLENALIRYEGVQVSSLSESDQSEYSERIEFIKSGINNIKQLLLKNKLYTPK